MGTLEAIKSGLNEELEVTPELAMLSEGSVVGKLRRKLPLASVLAGLAERSQAPAPPPGGKKPRHTVVLPDTGDGENVF